MHGKSARRSSLFLLEIMISILMFSVAAAWCVRLFVTERVIVSETEELNRAQNLASGYAEMFLASRDLDAFLLGEGAKKQELADDAVYQIWYNKNWETCTEEEAVFCLETVITRQGDFDKCSFSFSKMKGESKIWYLFDVEKYTGGEIV